MEEQTKKSYNPFKMWGSWVGVGIIFMLIIWDLEFFNPAGNNSRIFNPLAGFLRSLFFPTSPNWMYLFTDLIIPFVVPLILGFLMGWLIHSLIRKIKNRNK